MLLLLLIEKPRKERAVNTQIPSWVFRMQCFSVLLAKKLIIFLHKCNEKMRKIDFFSATRLMIKSKGGRSAKKKEKFLIWTIC